MTKLKTNDCLELSCFRARASRRTGTSFQRQHCFTDAFSNLFFVVFRRTLLDQGGYLWTIISSKKLRRERYLTLTHTRTCFNKDACFTQIKNGKENKSKLFTYLCARACLLIPCCPLLTPLPVFHRILAKVSLRFKKRKRKRKRLCSSKSKSRVQITFKSYGPVGGAESGCASYPNIFFVQIFFCFQQLNIFWHFPIFRTSACLLVCCLSLESH